MKVFVVTHNNRAGGRVRAIFFTREAADEYVRPGKIKKTIKCGDCRQQKPNPEYDHSKAWKSCLEIEQWTVEGEPA
jgi:hypothetical protein